MVDMLIGIRVLNQGQVENGLCMEEMGSKRTRVAQWDFPHLLLGACPCLSVIG